MDSRVRDHAETLVDWSARIDSGDDVVVRVGVEAHDLAVAVVDCLGERGIDRPTGQILFDEKMAGTVHLALGRAYDACAPDGSGNDSAVHEDLITDMRAEGTSIEIDGKRVQHGGLFRWDEGSENGTGR